MLLKRGLVGLSAALILANLAPVTATAAAPRQCWSFKSSERGFATRINAARAARGVHKLRIDPQLSKVARKHNAAMTTAGSLYHSSSTQLRGWVTNWSLLGENVGVGSTVASLNSAFMHSAPHRANVLRSSFRHVGVGVARAHGRMWVTVLFESRRNPGTTLPMPGC